MAHRFVHHPPHASTICIFLLSVLLLVQLSCAFKKLDKPTENESTKFSTNSIGVTKMIDLNTRTIAYKDFVRKTCYIEKITTQPIWENRRLLFIHPKPLTNDELLTIAGPTISLFCFGWQVRILRLQSNNEIRRRRSTDPYFFVARKPRGQTQSQYLNFGGGEPGKAEAESSNTGSKALVYGSNGMGQAQSQSGALNCADCYGSGDRQLQSMKPGQTFPAYTQSSDEPGATHTIQEPGYTYDATSRSAGTPGSFQQPERSQYPSTSGQGGQQPSGIYEHPRPGQQQIYDQPRPSVFGPDSQIYQQGTPGTGTGGTPPGQTFQTPGQLYKPGISGQPQSGQIPSQFATTSPGTNVQLPGQLTVGPQQTGQFPISYPGQQISQAGIPPTAQQQNRPGPFQTGAPGQQPGIQSQTQQPGSQFPTEYQGSNFQQSGGRGQQPDQLLGGHRQQSQPGTYTQTPIGAPGLHQTIPGGTGPQILQRPGSQQPSTTGQQLYHPGAGHHVYTQDGSRGFPVTSDQQNIRYGQPESIGATGTRIETSRGPQTYGQDTLHKPSGHPPQIGDIQVIGSNSGSKTTSPTETIHYIPGGTRVGPGTAYQQPPGGTFSGNVVGQYESPIGHTGDFTGSIQGNYNLHGGTPGGQYQTPGQAGQTEQQGTGSQILTHPGQISTRPITGSQIPGLYGTPQGQIYSPRTGQEPTATSIIGAPTVVGGRTPGTQGTIIPGRTSPDQIFRPGSGQVPIGTTTTGVHTPGFSPSGQIYQSGIYDSSRPISGVSIGSQIPQTQQAYGGQTPGSTSLTPSDQLYGQQQHPIASQIGSAQQPSIAIGSQTPGSYITTPSGQIYSPSQRPIPSGTGTPVDISGTRLPTGQLSPGTSFTGQPNYTQGQIPVGTQDQYGQQYFPGQTMPSVSPTGQTYAGTTGSGQTYPGTASSGQIYPGPTGSGQTYPGTASSGQIYPGTTGSGQTYPDTAGSGQIYPGTTGSGQTYTGISGSTQPGQLQQPSGPAGTTYYPGQSHIPSDIQTSYQPHLPGSANQQYGTSSDGRGGQGQFTGSAGQSGQTIQQAPGKLIYGGQDTQLYGSGAPGTISDDSNSQAQSTIQRVNNETQAMASSSGRYNGGNAQSQVSGAYSGQGSFSASAGTNDGVRAAQTQIIGNNDGVVSSSQGQGGRGQSQAQVQMAGETGDTKSSAQSSGINHGTNTQVQSGIKGGMADAQANGPGSTSSQAQIGFSPYDATEEEADPENPHNGGASASAASGNHAGKSQVQINGRYAFGIRYTGQAQASSANAGHSADDFNLPTMKPFEYAQTHSAQTQPDKTSQKVRQVDDGKILKLVTSTTTKLPPTVENDMQYDYDDDDYDDSEDTQQKNLNLVQHQQLQRHTRNNSQMSIDPVEEMPLPRVELKLKHGDVLQGGESIPGSSGYKIPAGFRGRIAEHNINLQQPQIVYAAGANSNRHKTNLDDIGYGSGFSYQPTYSPIQYGFKSTRTHPFVSVTKSETGSRNVLTGKKTPSVYYTQSSTCGYFTNTCFYSNGKKICIPKFKSHPHGSPIVCKN